MAYYTKQEIVEFINSSCELIKEKKYSIITDPQKALKELADEQDIVGFFWLELSSNGENSVGINMPGKAFVRLESEIYTDDRFAMDSYHAAQEKVMVTDIIKKRNSEKEAAKNNVSGDMIENIKKMLAEQQGLK